MHDSDRTQSSKVVSLGTLPSDRVGRNKRLSPLPLEGHFNSVVALVCLRGGSRERLQLARKARLQLARKARLQLARKARLQLARKARLQSSRCKDRWSKGRAQGRVQGTRARIRVGDY